MVYSPNCPINTNQWRACSHNTSRNIINIQEAHNELWSATELHDEIRSTTKQQKRKQSWNDTNTKHHTHTRNHTIERQKKNTPKQTKRRIRIFPHSNKHTTQHQIHDTDKLLHVPTCLHRKTPMLHIGVFPH